MPSVVSRDRREKVLKRFRSCTASTVAMSTKAKLQCFISKVARTYLYECQYIFIHIEKKVQKNNVTDNADCFQFKGDFTMWSAQ